MPRPHPAHMRRRGLVSQVQILGLALEAWSGQSNRRVANNLKWEQALPIVLFQLMLWNPLSNTDQPLQGFNTSLFKPKDSRLWHQTPPPSYVSWVGMDTRLAPIPFNLPANTCVYLYNQQEYKVHRASVHATVVFLLISVENGMVSQVSTQITMVFVGPTNSSY